MLFFIYALKIIFPQIIFKKFLYWIMFVSKNKMKYKSRTRGTTWCKCPTYANFKQLIQTIFVIVKRFLLQKSTSFFKHTICTFPAIKYNLLFCKIFVYRRIVMKSLRSCGNYTCPSVRRKKKWNAHNFFVASHVQYKLATFYQVDTHKRKVKFECFERHSKS